MANPFARLSLVKPTDPAEAEREQIPPKNYSVIRLVGCFGFYCCLILMAFSVVGLRDLNLAGVSLLGGGIFGFVWLFGAIEMRLIMLDEALKRVARGSEVFYGTALARFLREPSAGARAMIDTIEEIDAFEPRLGFAPVPFAPASMFIWVGMFAAVYVATSSMIAMMYVRR